MTPDAVPATPSPAARVALFLSDVHLGQGNAGRQEALVDLLDRYAPRLAELFVLGDLFDFWFSYRSVVFVHYLPALAALGRLRDRGARLTYLTGNHDFAFNSTFERLTGATIHRRPLSTERQGIRLYLCHGDQINTRDYGYRLVRGVLHNRVVQGGLRLVHPDWAWRVAEALAHGSRRVSQQRLIPEDLYQAFLGERLREGCDLVVHGHTHVAALREVSAERRLVVLNPGDWIESRSYGLWADGRVRLMRYPVEVLGEVPLPRRDG